MAQIRSFNPDPQPARPPRTEVDCLYTSVQSEAGTRLLRLATLGSDHRKREPKPSQIIELDQEMAEKLILIMAETFPGIRLRSDSA